MSKKAEEKYWFKAKRYGWGWGLPQTSQGWAVLGASVAVWLLALMWFTAVVGSAEPSLQQLVIFGAIMTADVAGLLYFSLKYGEPPKWRWGKKKS